MGPVMEAAPRAVDNRGANLEHLLNVKVPVIVRLANKRMHLEAIAQMSIGTIIEFDKRPDEELELMIGNKTIGFGLAVKTGEHFGLRIRSICDLKQTIQAMGPQTE